MNLPKSVTFIGASSTEGFVDPEGGGFVGRFRSWLQSQNPKYSVYNLGIQNDTSTGILKRAIPELIPRHCQLVIVQVCTNDAAREEKIENPPKVPLVQMEDNFYTLINQLQMSSEVICLSPTPIDQSKTTPVSWDDRYYLMEDIDRYHQKAFEICQSLGVDYLDIFSDWQKQDYFSLLDQDGLHPNSEGHQKIAQIIIDHLIK